jgi:hypothetical protein
MHHFVDALVIDEDELACRAPRAAGRTGFEGSLAGVWAAATR